MAATNSNAFRVVIAPRGELPAFFDLPTQADEEATYARWGWAWSASAREPEFATDPAPFDDGIDPHNDLEGDDLWTHYQQYLRSGHDRYLQWARRWRDYFTEIYPTDVVSDDYGFDYDHVFGTGLVLWSVKNADAAALASAEAIGDIAIGEMRGERPAPAGSTGYGGGRGIARWLLLFGYLAQATESAKWIGWRDALIERYVHATNWEDSTTSPLVAGGHYFCDRDWMDYNGQGGVGAYDAGRRSNSTFMYGLHAEAMWRAYLATERSDVREKLVAMARFVEHYGHDPSHTLPFASSYFGHERGDHWHRDVNENASATYDISVVNTLVWGYKLTADRALLDRARAHFRQGTRWAEGEPSGGGGPLVAEDEVAAFVDVRTNPDAIFFDHNKGQLQYCYQIFENGGDPAVL